MKTVHLVGLVAGGAALAALCGSGIAAADDQFNGQTYAEAEQALSKAGMSSRVGTVSGDQLPTGQCIVTESRTMGVVGSSGATGGSEVVLDLDCNETAATDD